MPYIILITFFILALIYMVINKRNDVEENLMEDVPTISVNSNELQKHAQNISTHYSEVVRTNCKRKLIKSLDLSYRKIIKGYDYIDRDARNKKEIIPAAEWLLDNLYLVEKEYKDIKHNLPEKYYKELPVITMGIMKGYPRVYHIAVELVSHTDGRVDSETIKNFVSAYQKNTILTIGELWAIPIMLRIALIQNISNITEKMIIAQKEKLKADIVAEKLIHSVDEEKLNDELIKLNDYKEALSSHFVERLLKTLRYNGIDNEEIYNWLDDKLKTQQSNTEKMIAIEHQRQAGFQLSIGNSINSLRVVEAINWRNLFEILNDVELILKKDPLNIYDRMDFESRDFYRHEVEKMARKMKVSESYIAGKAVELAEKCGDNSEKEYLKHVGYYLVDSGRERLKLALQHKENNSNENELSINKTKNRVRLYVGSIIGGTILLILLFMYLSFINDMNVIWSRYAVAFLVLVIPCSEIVVSILNWSINNIGTPTHIPKIELKEDIPEEFSTMVVIPTLLNNEKRVRDLVSDMEVYYLANTDKNIYFGLLGDFMDSQLEHEENDGEIVEAALKDVELLNKKYSTNGEDIFYFFNRSRKFNDKENKWMGWERKRGKLVEFNLLLRGDKNTSYNVISGDIEKLTKIKYIITLDADTKLPRDSARRLIGAMAHTLNKPYINKELKIVERGYGLMQPKISIGTVSANKTLFSKIFSGETGIDTYSLAISDVYQDLFDEGIFTGKGIYDIDVYNFMLKDEIQDNKVLSHDLLEGSYVRTALVTDIELIDGYPAYYNSSSKRLHRWVRGDWQLIPFLKKKNLNLLSKWKIIDNLRRSLVSPSLIILVLLSFNVLPDGTDKWISAALIALICPLLFDVTESVVQPIKGLSLSGKIDGGKMVVEQVLLIFCFLPYVTYLMLDAIVRTIYRLCISKRKMLEWVTSADEEARSGKTFKNYASQMWSGSLISILIIIVAFSQSYNSGLLMLPSCILWFLSPYIAYYISKDRQKGDIDFSKEQKVVLRKLSRRTWAYFEDFVGPKDNWLAPDNYQEDPNNGVAHRTSPTNMGMGIISNIAAYDLGYIGILETVERVEKIISSLEKLKRYKGHFYNWYNTLDGEPLYPKYISTVDSGNLVGYLWVTAEALDEYLKNPVINKSKYNGLCDTLKLAEEEIEMTCGIKNYYTDIIEEIQESTVNILSFKKILLDIWSMALKVERKKSSSNLYWNNKIKNEVSIYLREMQKLFPWSDIVIERTDKMISFVDNLIEISSSISLDDLYSQLNKVSGEIKLQDYKDREEKYWVNEAVTLIKNGKENINNLCSDIRNLIIRLNNLVTATDFSTLYNKERQLFSIGYDVEQDTLGESYYDLLASEARAASFIAIAKGDVEQKHWFKLGRAMTVMGRSKGLVSWTGTMFEYFMPLLIMKNYPDTLLNETYKSVIEGQKKYCKERRIPWGISESAFYTFDICSNYQYKAFGIPGIGLKRGLVNEVVVSPYSTVLAMQIDKQGAYSNIIKLMAEGLEGRYGLYESIDYTKERVPKGKKRALVKCFMVHHEGMSLMALNNLLNDNVFQKRFHRVPKVKATELLLQERVPKRIIYDREQQFDVVDGNLEKQKIIGRTYTNPKSEMPETLILSNGNYSVMINDRGSGYSKKEDTMMYRWNGDTTNDNKGMFFYIKDVNLNNYWSATFEPCKDAGENYRAIFSLDKAEFYRVDEDIKTETTIAVSNDDNVEVRSITLINNSDETKLVEITSYCEVTLTRMNADLVHPAFSNLFVKTKYMDEPTCIIATRRARSKNDPKHFMMQTVAVEGNVVGTVQYETSRVNFIGRNRDVSNPMALDNDVPLQNTVGAVLDPIISIRRRIKIKPKDSCKIAFTTSYTDSEEAAIELARKYNDMQNINRVFELAWTQTQVEMKYMGIKSSQANLYQVMASKLLYLNNSLRNREDFIKTISKGQSCLWGYGISGDVPIVLVIMKNENEIDILKQIINAHEYWSIKGLKIDLVVINEEEASYMQPVQDKVRDIIASSHARDKQNTTGGIFLLNKGNIEPEDLNLLKAISKLVILGEKGLLINQVKSRANIIKETDELNRTKLNYESYPFTFKVPKLEFFNSIGGFDKENNKYIIKLKKGINTPAPWINVISNSNFGFHVSENGVSYTWCKNSRENKITPWYNDWVSDRIGEGMYLRDEISGERWGITPKPLRDDGEYLIEHGFGYSTFKHYAYGIIGEVTMFVPLNENLKLCKVTLKNNSSIERELSLSYYAAMVLGVVPEQTGQFISTYLDKENKYIYAKNPYDENFGKNIAFLSIIGGEEESFSGSRTEFLGKAGSEERPEALDKIRLSNTVGAGFDPCLSENVKIKLNKNEEKTLLILLGENEDINNISEIVTKYENLKNADDEYNKSTRYWEKLLGTIQVNTPDSSMNMLLNGWLMYQTLTCRIWSRTAFYQSGGAYGFRDQLQDVMPVCFFEEGITKNQILYSASRQYLEGDVQHWWHPVVDSGIRTRFSDDLLWLPYVTADYIKNTGDYSILDIEVPYLEDEPLKEGEDERYNISKISDYKGSIFEHCIKAINKSLNFGSHNIPLMGSGDWNDGMSTVGNEGKGESVWLGWFLYSILEEFIKLCTYKKEEELTNKFQEYMGFLKENINKNAWDGNWYRRAYFDDGTALGSVENDECQIDSLAQSWAVISGAGDAVKVKEAMNSLKTHLVKEDKGMVLLLTPPFHKSKLEPGYIKGYVPGVRENGGQYTHAATWVILAFAKMGNSNEAWKVFNMINPINHAKTHLECERYKVEPYVMAADVYGREPHTGRGGWTWYTGTSGWMYRVGLEGILGFKLCGGKGFTIDPCIPEEWSGFSMKYTKNNCTYDIEVKKGKKRKILLDEKELEEDLVPYLDEGNHKVTVIVTNENKNSYGLQE